MFDTSNLVAHNWTVYERLVDHPEGMRYRYIICSDDYDYVEDEELCDLLDTLPTL